MDIVYLYNAVAGAIIASAVIVIAVILKLKELSNQKPSEWLIKIVVVLVIALVVVASIDLFYTVKHYLLGTGGCGHDC